MAARSTSRALRVARSDRDAAAFGDVAPPRPAPLLLGRDETGDAVEIDLPSLLGTRLLVQGMSGAGKSWLLRRILEETAERLQQVVIDPEGEFGTLAEAFGHTTLDAARLDAEALGEAASHFRRARLSFRLDIAQAARPQQLAAVAAVLDALVRPGPEHWHGCLVAIDEAHLFAPQGAGGGPDKRARGASLAAMIDLVGRGRKRGLCAVLATQRFGALARSVASEAGNVLVGLNRQDIDIARAAAAVGWKVAKADGILRVIRPGHFIASGPAFTRSPVEVRVGPVRTRHGGAAPALLPPPTAGEPAIDVEALEAASQRRSALRQSGRDPAEVAAVRAFLDAPGASEAARAYRALRLEYPLPLLRGRLARELGLPSVALDRGLDLLVAHGLARRYGAADDPTLVAL